MEILFWLVVKSKLPTMKCFITLTITENEDIADILLHVVRNINTKLLGVMYEHIAN